MNSPRYILLGLVASAMIMGALVAHYVPEALAFAGADLRDVLVVNWAYVLLGGIALGALNAYMTFAKKRVAA